MKPAGRVGDIAFCPSDSHGCPGCAHPVQGPAIQGSPNVLINDLPALRDRDEGIHSACCGPNRWQAKGGASYVLLNDRRTFRNNDVTRHCGGTGMLIGGSSNVLVGDEGGKTSIAKQHWIEILVTDRADRPLPNVCCRVKVPGGDFSLIDTDDKGLIRINLIDEGICEIEIEGEHS